MLKKLQQYPDKNSSIDKYFEIRKATAPLSRPHPASPPSPKEKENGNGFYFGEGVGGEGGEV